MHHGAVTLTGVDRGNIRQMTPPFERIPLVLDPAPDDDWSRMFNRNWAKSAYTMKRQAEAQGGQILLEAPLSEVAKYHLPAIELATASTNDEYAEFMQKKDEVSQSNADKLREMEKQRSAEMDAIEDYFRG